MRFTVTPLGGARNDVRRVVDGFLRFLVRPDDTGPPISSDSGGSSRYYAESREEPDGG